MAQTRPNQPPELGKLLETLGRYVDDYERSFSAVVSAEHYTQRALTGGVRETRNLRSDVALVAAGDAGWVMFRDVYHVDGTAIRDRDDRLASLFLKPTADSGLLAKRILDEGARYNVGTIVRTVNTPTQLLAFIRSANQPRSRFQLGGQRRVDGVETRELRFQETGTPRLIVTRDDAAASGRVWVVPAAGTVVRTELRLKSAGVSALWVVTYVRQDSLALWAPVEMTETYEQDEVTPATVDLERSGLNRVGSKSTFEGRATYSNFRKFSVDTSTFIRKGG
jgi:hypothetical protein